MHDYKGALTETIIAGRSADIHGAFFLPYLRPGMSVLDCGCGPGTITVGLAQAASPGTVIGIDIEESQLERARQNAAELGLVRIKFERGSAYELPCQDNLFDAVFSHALLEHMQDPLAVLREVHRVLKPGGVVGIRSVDLAATLITPAGEVLENAYDIWLKYRQYCGGDPFLGRRLRGLVREAGFARTTGSASSEAWGTPQKTRSMMSVLAAELTGPKIAETAIQMGWADRVQMDSAASALTEWGSHPDAFMAMVWCEAIGWKA